MDGVKERLSLGELFAELTHELATLLRQELALARVELAQKASRAGRDVALLAAGGAVVYAGFLAIVASAIFGLALLMPAWVAALVAGLVVLAIGGGLVAWSWQQLKHAELTPQATLATLRDDVEWAKEQTR